VYASPTSINQFSTATEFAPGLLLVTIPATLLRSIRHLNRRNRFAYCPTSKRDLRIDFLRGWAVVIMFIDHLAGPSVLYMLTASGQFLTSAAEGFVFISGFVAAVVYGRIASRKGLLFASRRMLRRAAVLYLPSTALTIVVVPCRRALRLWAM